MDSQLYRKPVFHLEPGKMLTNLGLFVMFFDLVIWQLSGYDATEGPSVNHWHYIRGFLIIMVVGGVFLSCLRLRDIRSNKVANSIFVWGIYLVLILVHSPIDLYRILGFSKCLYWIFIYYAFYSASLTNDISPFSEKKVFILVWICFVFVILRFVLAELYSIRLGATRVTPGGIVYDSDTVGLGLGYELVWLLPLFLSHTCGMNKRRLFCIFIIVSGVVYSMKRGAQLALVFALIGYFVVYLKQNRNVFESRVKIVRVAIIIITCVLICGLVISSNEENFVGRWKEAFSGDDSAGSSRMLMWSEVFEGLKESDIFSLAFGNGFQSTNDFLNNVFIRSHAHNDFLQVIFDLGILGLLLYINIIYQCCMLVYRLYRKNSSLVPQLVMVLMIFIVRSFFSGCMTRPEMLWFALFIAYASVVENKITAVNYCRNNRLLRRDRVKF